VTFANLRAQAWKIAAIGSAALGVAALVACVFLAWRGADARSDAAAQKERADRLASDLEAVRQAQVRDAIAANDAAIARRAIEAQVTQHNERAHRVEIIAYEPRPPVPADCPLPDPRLVRELEEGAGRVRAAVDQLRSLHGPAGGAAGAAER